MVPKSDESIARTKGIKSVNSELPLNVTKNNSQKYDRRNRLGCIFEHKKLLVTYRWPSYAPYQLLKMLSSLRADNLLWTNADLKFTEWGPTAYMSSNDVC